MNLKILTYIFFHSVLTASHDKQYESDDCKKCITNPITSSSTFGQICANEKKSQEKIG